MKNTLIAFALAATTVTAAASDIPSIPSRSNPVAPVSRALPAPSFWVGINGGVSITDGLSKDSPWSVGAVAGYNVFKIGPVGFGVEGTYDFTKSETHHVSLRRPRPDYTRGGTHDVAGNVIASYSFGSLTPYALGGIGYRWSDVKNENIWNAGGGVKYSFARNFEIDARYRHIENVDRTWHDDRVTLGANFKF